MRSPLTVRVSDGVRDQQVTRFVKGLRFTKTAPGGHHSASVSIDAPADQFAELGPADRLFIYDGRTARTLWDGYVDNPGRTVATGGEAYDISAMGGVTLASDNARAVVFVTRDLSGSSWKRQGAISTASTEVLEDPSFGLGPAYQIQIPSDSAVTTGGRAESVNTAFDSLGQPLHKVTATAVMSTTDLGYAVGVYGKVGVSSAGESTVPMTAGFANLLLSFDVSAPGFPTSFLNASPAFFVRRDGSAITTPAAVAALFFAITMRPALRNAAGAYVNATDNGGVYAHEVVGHLVGEGILDVDKSLAQVAPSSFLIRNLAYLDGVKPFQILDDLSLYEPDMLWEILESNAAGKHRFAYRAWPTTPRYEISGRDFTESGGEVDLCNRIVVSWKDATGAEQTTTRTAVVADLDRMGRIKDADPISLPDGQGSETNANRIGDQVLAALNTPSRAGSAVVSEPILDLLSGHTVMPWEIEPGYLVRVRDRGIDLRLTEMTYDDTDCSTSMTLGSPTLSLAQRIAGLGRG